MRQRRRGVNPRAKRLLIQAVNNHPYWTPADYAVILPWMITKQRKEGVVSALLARAPSATVINKMIVNDPDLLALAGTGKIAAPIRKSHKSRDPDWVSMVPPGNIQRVATGQALDTIRQELVDRANEMKNENARKKRIEMIDHDIALLTATPTERIMAFSRSVDDAEGTTDQIEKMVDDNVKLADEVRLLLKSAETTQLLLTRLLGDNPEFAQQPRGRRTAGDGEGTRATH